MLRSLYSGLSGLKAHQVDLDVIANNVANVNTAGFKAGRVIFADLLSQTLKQAQAPTDTLGGVNPSQVGMGVKVGGIDLMMQQGPLQPTSNPSDLAIQGEGFFVLEDPNEARLLCRTGSFQLDASGYLVHRGSGLRLVGWAAKDGVIDRAVSPSVLKIDQSSQAPRATSNIVYSGNLDARLPKDQTVGVPVTIYDSLGKSHSALLQFTMKDPDNRLWEMQLSLDGTNVLSSPVEVTFDTTGKISSPATPVEIGYAVGGGADPLNFKLDLSRLTMRGQPTSAVAESQDGYAGAELEDVSVEADGRVIGHYTDGRLHELGQLALATVVNPAGLSREGSSLYRTTLNSGPVQYGQAASGNRGQILSSTLEMSNVDLTEEFSNMIVAQRGFQANTKTVTTSDQILQEVVNLIR
ncbi:MAG: flagellar hook protein FlgE [Limnochordaceae bacterium]|nr:flagellar hook protein FlgE [Limnochordaceae bacterium]